MYGNDKTKFVEVAGPGHFNDPDEVNVEHVLGPTKNNLYYMVQSMHWYFVDFR